MTIPLPFRFPDRYTFAGQAFEGGQGVVYVCKDALLARPVAIKVMKFAADATDLRHELANLKEIRSKHVIEIYDLLVDPSTRQMGLVSEYVSGPTLEEWSKQSHASELRLSVLNQLACGVADIHSHDKVHRDIKPENARLDGENVLKVLDFGLAQTVSPYAKTMFSRGTFYYRAPELYGTLPARIIPAVDVYAFGVTAAMVLNGGSIPTPLLSLPPSHVGFTFASVPGSLAPEVVAALDSCVALNPADRPTMREINTIIERRLLYGKHRAIVRWQGKQEVFSTPGKRLNLRRDSDAIWVNYDGLVFQVLDPTGNVYINNRRAQEVEVLPGSCVVTIGEPALGFNRVFVTIDMSHPGVES